MCRAADIGPAHLAGLRRRRRVGDRGSPSTGSPELSVSTTKAREAGGSGPTTPDSTATVRRRAMRRASAPAARYRTRMRSAHQPILDGFKRLRASWPHRGWSYDDHFDCVASSFDADFAPQARDLLAPLFPFVITERTLASASAPIRAVAARTGGIRATQMIFAADAKYQVTPYGLWWPWEEARTISLRLGIDGSSAAELEELRACFGIVR